MKTTNTIALIFLAVLFSFLVACPPPLETGGTQGRGTLVIVTGEGSDRNLYQWTDTVVSYSASGDGPGSEIFSRDWNVEDACHVDSLAVGLWIVTVYGKDSGGSQVTTGQVNATVIAGQSTNATVTLGYIPGTGSVSFAVSWPATIDVGSVEGVLKENGTTPRTLSFAIAGQSATASLAGVTAGDHHQFTLALKKPDTTTLYATTGTIHITNGKNTPVVIALSEADINNPPAVPGSFTAVSGPFCVNLAWTNVDAVTGFFIERKKTSDSTYQQIAEIPGDALSYRDISVVRNQGYDYRIIAFKTAGESQPALASVTTEDFRIYQLKRRITFGGTSMLRVEADGSVKGFGTNNDGELGSSSKLVSFSGVTIPGLNDVVALSSSTDFTSILALKGDGTAWEWGSYAASTPRQVAGLTRQIVAVSRGVDFSLALDADGFVWAWGNNSDGQIGDGTTTHPSVPYRVPGLPEISSVSAGDYFSLATALDGRVFAWGYNLYGQLGFGDTTERLVPTQVPGITQAKSVWSCNVMNSYSSFIIMNNGKVYAAGDNRKGQLGLGSSQYKTFTEVFLSQAIIQIQSGLDYTLFLADTGKVSKAGANNYGVLQPVNSLTDVKEIFSQAYHAIARVNPGSGDTWYGWGLRQYGELGNGDTSITPYPVAHAAPAIFTSISTSTSNSLALDSAGDVWAWGYNASGQVGDGTKVTRATPVKVLDDAVPVIRVETDNDASAAVLSDGRIALWGNLFTASPVIQTDPALAGIKQVALGSGFRIVLKNDGSVWSWGTNPVGQLGDGSTTTRYTPVQVHGVNNVGYLSNVRSIDTGNNHAIAMLEDGRVVGWGSGYNGQLGSIDVPSNYPIEIPEFANSTSMLADMDFSFVLNADGNFWGCGGWRGVIRRPPILIASLSGLTGVASYDMSSDYDDNIIIRMSDGSVRTYGENRYCQMGDGTTYSPSGWYAPTGPANIALVAVGSGWMTAYGSTGTVWCWGDDSLGQFGDGTINPSYASIPVLLPW